MILLERYRIQIQRPPCIPSAEWVNAVVEFEDDLSDLLPYINAELGPGIFNRNGPFLRLNHGGRAIVFYPHRICINKLKDEAEAEAVFQSIREQVRSIAQRRDEIEPSYRTLGEVTALQVYKVLPRTNCRKCGFATCFAFAAALAQGEADIEQCAPLWGDEYVQQRGELQRMLGLSG